MREIPLIVFATLFLTSFNFIIHGIPQNFLLLLLWTAPVWIFWFLTNTPYGEPFNNPKPLLLTALGIYLISMLIDLNILSHLALAISIAAFIPLSPYSVIWILGSFFWIPASGWLLNKINMNYDIVKAVGILLTMMPLLYKEWRER